jgi:hypothetical protein
MYPCRASKTLVLLGQLKKEYIDIPVGIQVSIFERSGKVAS